MSKIFLIIDRKQEGPFSNEEVRDKLGAGVIDGDTFARLDEGSEWFPLSNFIEVSAFPQAKKAEPPGRPLVLWMIAIFYIVMYAYWAYELAAMRLRFPSLIGQLRTDSIMMAVFLVSLLKIGAGIVLLFLRKVALYLLLAAFVLGLAVSAIEIASFGHQGVSGTLLERVALSTVVQIVVLIYVGGLVKNRTLR